MDGRFIITALRRHKVISLIAVSTVLAFSALAYLLYGAHYKAEALLLVGNGIKERLAPPGTTANDTSGALNSLARIAQTDTVLSEAATKVGYERLFAASEREGETNSILIIKLRRRLSAKPEIKSDILRITFRDSDPVIAAEFVNAVAEALTARQAELFDVPGAVHFFTI